ncbi:MAG: hypothetical protein NWF10_03040 [Candidatus Bathyarchaeota archaeon]|nr:hypothetical protein [Candidatus Bathyarchaeota archaeon]
MNKKAAQNILSKVSETCKISKKTLILNKQSKNNYEIHIGKSLQEKEWLCIEEIVSDHNLRLKLVDNTIILY